MAAAVAGHVRHLVRIHHCGADAAAVAEQAAAGSVTGRFTAPEEVADLVLLLAATARGTSPGRTSSSTAG
ncbi:MAG TPA: hypothetical protein VES60_17395 [Nakamurella sp.]|nr:hypothetical protein [Nakamurella sp.]